MIYYVLNRGIKNYENHYILLIVNNKKPGGLKDLTVSICTFISIFNNIKHKIL